MQQRYKEYLLLKIRKKKNIYRWPRVFIGLWNWNWKCT